MNEALTITQGIFPFIIITYSIILHEIAHGYAAYIQGDETANRAGRLTLNPLPHIDIIGSVIVPLFAFLSAGTFFGWAKPVPYNAYNIQTKIGQAFVAAAGVLTNLFFALLAGIVFKVLVATGDLTNSVGSALFTIIKINVSLAFFNLIPIPPFDGMAIIQSLFPKMHIRSNIIYNPLYMVGAIIGASVIYGILMPPVFGFVSMLLFL
ncbi:MAG: site-2 protease family protein [Candidatus Pacebacteria bacterium]|nr:site-2 protease family protein [Candidatus Paceibacterota bacterium]MBP9866986.1 site-2 protease family protein [Candidatus Paceibacterota bacterium]